VLCRDGVTPSSLGSALVWAASASVTELDVVVDAGGNDDAVAVMARRAETFAAPPRVWAVRGRELVAVAPAPMIDPAGTSALPADAAVWADQLVAHGVEPVIEHGSLRGDVLGLEVARLVPDGAGGWTLAVGVGGHDREARREMKPHEDPLDALDQVVEVVRTWRSPDARIHPANSLAPERWLRAVVVARPHLAGASDRADRSTPAFAGARRRHRRTGSGGRGGLLHRHRRRSGALGGGRPPVAHRRSPEPRHPPGAARARG
jgi:hypothetical protein